MSEQKEGTWRVVQPNGREYLVHTQKKATGAMCCGYSVERLDDAESAAQICEQVAAQSSNSLFRSGAKICAGEIRRAGAQGDERASITAAIMSGVEKDSSEDVFQALSGAAARVRDLFQARDAFPQLEAQVDRIAAIQFALEADEGMAYLRLRNQGEFEACRREWTEAPDECYIGADQFFVPKAEGDVNA